MRRPVTCLALLLTMVLALPGRGAFAAEPGRTWLGVTLGRPDILDRDLAPATDDGDADEGATPEDLAAAAAAASRGPVEDKQSADGALVMGVVRDSPADRAGLRGGDIIHRIAGVDVHTADEVMRDVAKRGAGYWVEIEFVRQGKERRVSVRLDTRSGSDGRLDLRRPWAGLTPLDAPLQLRTYWGGSEREGVLVGEVVAGGPAARAGIQPGDLVLRVDTHPVATATALAGRVQLGGVGNTVVMSISRQGTRFEAAVDLDDEPPRVRPATRQGPTSPRGHR